MVDTNLNFQRQEVSKNGAGFLFGASIRYFLVFSSRTRLRKFLLSKKRKAASMWSLIRLSSRMFFGNFVKNAKYARFRAHFVLHFLLGPESDYGRSVKSYFSRKFRSETSRNRREGFGKVFRVENGIYVNVGIRKVGRDADGGHGNDSELFVFSRIAKAFERHFGNPGGKVRRNFIGSGSHERKITARYYGIGRSIQGENAELTPLRKPSRRQFRYLPEGGIAEARFPWFREPRIQGFPFHVPVTRKRVRREPA